MPSWNDTEASRIRELLTDDRLSSYLRSTPDFTAALRLYEWNVEASAAALELTGLVEVFVRNAMCDAFARWDRTDINFPWFRSIPMDSRGRADVAKAVDRSNWSPGQGAGRVVAELSFGFWRYLAASRYHASLWVPCLHRAFPYGAADLRLRRQEVEADLKSLLLLRNRAAHHEPIHRRTLVNDERVAGRLLDAVDPVASQWALSRSRLGQVAARRPE